MKGYAVQRTGPCRYELREFTEESPLPDDAVEGPALASAVSPGTELASYGKPVDPAAPRGSGTGYAMVFRVARAGAASGFTPGDVVFAPTGSRSWVRCDSRNLREEWKVPAGVAPADAALARLAGVSWSTLTTTLARPPDRVAVTGLGIVGNLAAQIFAASGYQVLACDPVAGRRELLARRGIEVCERLPLKDSPWAGATDLVVECSGHEAAALDACRLVRKGGEVVLVGVPWEKRTELSAFDILNTVFMRYVRLRSGWEWEVPGTPTEFGRGSIQANIAAAIAWFGSGRLSSAGLFRRVDPRDCDAVYRELKEQPGGMLTAVFDWTMLENKR